MRRLRSRGWRWENSKFKIQNSKTTQPVLSCAEHATTFFVRFSLRLARAEMAVLQRGSRLSQLQVIFLRSARSTALGKQLGFT
jgi:hypothetical protein